MDDPILALLPQAKRRFARTDPVMARILKAHPPEARSLEPKPPFSALVESITHQQVSLAAGRTIFGRVETACGGAVTPDGVLRAGATTLRAAGLSTSKTNYVLDLAAKTTDGTVDFKRLAEAPDEEVIATLTQVKGIGVWTAKMFLIFHLSRPDVVAHEDLGLRIAVADAYDVPREDAAKHMQALAPKWSPYASLVALALWNWRRITMDRMEK